MLRTLLISLALTVAGIPQETHHGDYKKHRLPHSAEEYAKMLEDPTRESWQKPHQVVEALELRPGSTVADIGAGTGYFALRFAHWVGAEGKVLAVDIDPKLLERARLAGEAQKLANLVTVLAAPDDPHLGARTVDVIFLCDVIHHIENRPAYYPWLARALKPAGRLAIVDFHKRPLPVGPPPAMKIAREDMIGELESAGFRLAGEHTFLPHQYYLVFEVK